MKLEKFPPLDREAYYAQGQSWAGDVKKSLRQSRRYAWIAAGVCAAIAMLEAVALALLIPLKAVVPYAITVDRQTGYVETIQPLKAGGLAQDEAVTNAFLAQYVLARETYDLTDLQGNYQKVASWTSGPARAQYIASMQRSNPQSPLNLNAPGTVVKTVVKSISLLSRSSALVRFDAERQGQGAQRQPYSAVIGFRYTGAPMRMEDRFLNPLGFEVTSYRRDAETTGPVARP